MPTDAGTDMGSHPKLDASEDALPTLDAGLDSFESNLDSGQGGSDAPIDAAGDVPTEVSTGADDGSSVDGPSEAEDGAPLDAGATSDASPDVDAACPAAAHSGSSAVAYQVDPQHTGAQPGDVLTLPLCQRWSHDFGSNVAVSTPVLANGLVYTIAVVTTGAGGQPAVYALDEDTGNIVWGPVNVGGANVSQPGGVTLDGTQLFAVSADGNGGGVMAALDAQSGAVSWTTKLAGESFWFSSPVALDGIVLATGQSSGFIAYAVRESDGTLLWTSTVVDEGSSPAMTSDSVYLHGACGAAARLDKNDGGVIWARAGSCTGAGQHSPSILGGQLYVVGEFANGVILDPSTGADGGTFDSTLTPAGSAGIGYFVPNSSDAISAIPVGTTTPLWSAGSQVETAPLVVGSNVVVGTQRGLDVYATADGGLVSSASAFVGTNAPGGPSLQEADGLLFVVSGSAIVAF